MKGKMKGRSFARLFESFTACSISVRVVVTSGRTSLGVRVRSRAS